MFNPVTENSVLGAIIQHYHLPLYLCKGTWYVAKWFNPLKRGRCTCSKQITDSETGTGQKSIKNVDG